MPIKFIKTKDPNNEFDRTNVTHEILNDEIDITSLLEDIEIFVRAIGYNFKGTLDIVEDEFDSFSEIQN